MLPIIPNPSQNVLNIRIIIFICNFDSILKAAAASQCNSNTFALVLGSSKKMSDLFLDFIATRWTRF